MGSSDIQENTQTSNKRPDIAIVGLGTLFPKSPNATLFWKNILDKKDLISDVPPSHWLIEDYYDPDPATPDKTYGKRGGFLGDTGFDPIEWGIPPNIIPATDTTQLLALIVAKMCLQNAAQGDFLSYGQIQDNVRHLGCDFCPKNFMVIWWLVCKNQFGKSPT